MSDTVLECACPRCTAKITPADAETYDGMCGQCWINDCNPHESAYQTLIRGLTEEQIDLLHQVERDIRREYDNIK